MIGRWFEKKQEEASVPARRVDSRSKILRHSGGWALLRKRLETEQGLRLLDVGSTSSSNVNYLTGLGQNLYMADLISDAWENNPAKPVDSEGNVVWNIDAFMHQSMNFTGRSFDVVLLWSTLDYLPEPLLEPIVAYLRDAMNPGGQVLAFFHTRMQEENTPCCRYHVTSSDDVEIQLIKPTPIQRVLSNRNIEKLFSGWRGHKQFLAKDNVSEAVFTR